MLSKKTLAATLVATIAAASSAHADDSFSWRFSGFGTVGYTATNTNDMLLVNPGQLKGAQEGGTGLVDSRVGGQLDLTFTSSLSATAQAIAMQDAKGRFRPTVEWAFLRYKLSSDTTLRLGRLGWPAYLVSDYRYVGYANPWVRAPLEVYNLAAMDNYEGADISWSHNAGAGYLTLQALGGHASSPLPDTTETTARLKVNQLAGAYVTYEIGNLRLRGGASTGKVTYRSDNLGLLVDSLQMVGFDQYASTINADGARTTFMSLGGNYDDGKLLLTSEYAKLRSASDALGTASGWYGTAGYHFGKWMPYVTWAGYAKRDNSSNYAFPPYPPLMPLAQGVDGLVEGNSQHTASAGVRWDVYKNVAIKLQADHVQPSSHGGTFTDVVPGYDGHAVDVYSAVVDFLF
ncbi:hypothetical protein [Rhodanobacter hydrolyticus]|uniref:Porin n=1 Tax=Rhodanobacter hydrolyticus TaxID=2250595 RepID=A0ABW8J944_9GAMM